MLVTREHILSGGHTRAVFSDAYRSTGRTISDGLNALAGKLPDALKDHSDLN
jgi:hypothetical protein